MAKTTFNKVGSQDILSAHINGLATGINNLETALNMKTATITGHVLNAVNDMEELENRQRIYEGTIRNWLNSPAPIVKKNGTVVNSSQYVIQPAFGVVVFNSPLTASDVVTVDITYITGESTILSDLVSKAGNDLSIPSIITRYNKDYLCNSANGYMPKQLCDNGGGGIGSASNAIETFPMICPEDCEIDSVLYKLNGTKPSSFVIVGVYDSIDGEPNNLIACTGKMDCSISKDVVSTFTNGNLKLSKGSLYYLSVYYSTAQSVIGTYHSQSLELEPELGFRNCTGSDALTTKTTSECKGIRMTNNVIGAITTTLPAVHPKRGNFTVTDFMYLGRLGYCTPFLHIKR